MAAISYIRLILYFDRGLLKALTDTTVFGVVLVGVIFLVSTIKPGIVGRAIQVVGSFATACGAAVGSEGGDLTSTVFLTAAMMLGSEYGFFQKRPRLAIGVPLFVYVVCFVSGTYYTTGVILASVHIVIAAVMVAVIFVLMIRIRLEQVRNREEELERIVADRTDGLRQEVNRRARLEHQLRETATQSQLLARERALLLHELHHRTKNDLQLIASMIRLHGEEETTSSKADVMEVAEDRIMAIALVHEYLYASDELSAIDLTDYLEGLLAHMRSAQSGSVIEIEEDLRADIAVGIEPAIHLGLAINELVQNSRKHGFPDGRRGRVRIETKLISDSLLITVSDNGIGIEEGVPANSGSIGMEIVRGLVGQLSGEVGFTSEEETTWRLRFPANVLMPKIARSALDPVRSGTVDTTVSSRTKDETDSDNRVLQ